MTEEAAVLIDLGVADECEEGGERARCGCKFERLVTVDRPVREAGGVENPVVTTVGRLVVGTATPGEGGAGASASVLAGAAGVGRTIFASTLATT